MSKLTELLTHGQSVWADFISRDFIKSGELKGLIGEGVCGVTSNPTIFNNAIAKSHDYDPQIKKLIEGNKSVKEIYESLVVEDIQAAADLFRGLYQQTKGEDGYVSLEVEPSLAHDTNITLSEAKRLFTLLAKENVMIKIPGTTAGAPAIREAIAVGININVTLLFSVAHYELVANAYIDGLEKLAANGGDLSKVSSVASFFVSRIDGAVDALLEAKGETDLMGKVAIANAKRAYQLFENIFSGKRWEALAIKGARKQRLLWASTSTKNPTYPDTLYVDELIGVDTVNTIPPATLAAFMDHGNVASTIKNDWDGAWSILEKLSALGINLDQICEELQSAGIQSFEESFDSLITSVQEKRDNLCSV